MFGDGSIGEAAPTVAYLERWAAFGGSCRIVADGPDGVTVSLCRCDAGEELQRFTTSDAAVVDWLAVNHSA